jgi:hypothetical protein
MVDSWSHYQHSGTRHSRGVVVIGHGQPIDSAWLEARISEAVANDWCLRINCGTCAGQDFRAAIGYPLVRNENGWRRLDPRERIDLINALRGLPEPPQAEEGVRWLLYQIWLADTSHADTTLFPMLKGSFAAEVLERMRRHHQIRLEARQIHDERQGMKKRDWKE